MCYKIPKGGSRMRLLNCIVYVAAIGLLSHIVGEALPRKWFNPTKVPYAPWKIEKNGKLYQTLKVRKWKDKLPDMSKISPKMVKKSISFNSVTSESISKVVTETCVAEMVHDALILFAPGLYLIWPDPVGAIFAVLYALSNIPFIIIQRYNRPTLVKLSQRLKQREERLENANSAAVR